MKHFHNEKNGEAPNLWSITFLSFSIFLLLWLLSVPLRAQERTPDSQQDPLSQSPETNLPAHWAYMGIEGPAHWSMLSKEFMICETGTRQSPINITMTQLNYNQEKLIFHYETSELHELNNGHTIQVSHVSGCRVDLNERAYKLRQFHFHAPSEHHINGEGFPMEMHLVHQDSQGRVLVLAVMLEADRDRPVLTKLWNWLPDQIGKEVSIPLEFRLSDILPPNTHHYSYSGSLTTPPCTEGVQWIVLKDPIHIARQDVDRFVEIIGENARPIQRIGDREIAED